MSSPLRPGASLNEELDYYKKQYEQLETDLAEFQASSKELEEQLERDIEAAEKNERKLKEQIDKLKYEAEEWKSKHQQAKAEANSAQNALQKEITAMRETNRTLQLRLRDIEVSNDDYERQARHTESSLEDLENKYNMAIERGVLLEGEMKSGEEEREALRIETQRLRDELGELKIESDITLEKLRLADDTIERLRSRKPSPLAVESLRARSPGSEASGVTPLSPAPSTPPPKSDSASDVPTPPSPPLSDTPAHAKVEAKTPLQRTRRSLIPDPATTLRPGTQSSRAIPRHTRGPSTASSAANSDAKSMLPPARPRLTSRPSITSTETLPRSDSLYQIRSLRGRMQKIEERVHSARSKLPPAKDRTPRGSPSTRSEATDNLPASITLRRSVRPSSNLGSLVDGASDTPSEPTNRRESQIKRLSFGIPRPVSAAADRQTPAFERPPSAAAVSRPSSRASRPSSRGSLASSFALPAAERPSSRIATATPSTTRTSALPPRSTSSIGGSYATMHATPRTHRPSASISELRRAAQSEDPVVSPTKGKYGTVKRQSGVEPRPGLPFGKSVNGSGGMRPPATTTARRKVEEQDDGGLGETY